MRYCVSRYISIFDTHEFSDVTIFQVAEACPCVKDIALRTENEENSHEAHLMTEKAPGRMTRGSHTLHTYLP